MNMIEVKKHIEVSILSKILDRCKDEAGNIHELKDIIYQELSERNYDYFKRQFEKN